MELFHGQKSLFLSRIGPCYRRQKGRQRLQTLIVDFSRVCGNLFELIQKNRDVVLVLTFINTFEFFQQP